jgi:hypothetical protein
MVKHLLKGLWIFTVIFFFNSNIVYGQLTGTYTIGPGGNFNNFSEAAVSLHTQGISGPVIFNVLSGTYTEHFVIDSISGASNTNTVTFQSQGGLADSVIIQYDAISQDSNYVVKLRDADYVVFQNLTFVSMNNNYGHAIVLEGKANGNQILNNVIIGNTYNQYAGEYHCLIFAKNQQVTGTNIAFNTIQNCGGASIFLQGNGGVTVNGTRIENNSFQNVNNAVYLNYNYAPVISHNRINAYNGFALYLVNCHGATHISLNRIIMPEGTGIYMGGCFASSGNRAKVVNNFLQIGVQNSWTAHAIDMEPSLGGCRYYDFYHNTIIENGSLPHNLFRLIGTGINAANNIFASLGTSPAFTIGDSNTVSLIDYNNIYTQTWQFVRWHSYEPVNFDSLKGITHRCDHSVSVYPHMSTPGEPYTLDPWLNNRGMPLPEVTTDIDGNPRDPLNPDLGCVEFTPDPATTTPLSGSYTVGSGGNYPTLGEALQDLMLKGISSAVTLDLLPGIYTEQVKIFSIPGSSISDTVTIQSQTGNPADVTINYVPGGSNDDYVFYLRGADHLRFKNLTLHSDTTTSGHSIIVTSGEPDDIKFTGNILRSTGSAHPINFDYTYCTRWILEKNQFSLGQLWFRGSNYAGGIHLLENNFTNSDINFDGISNILITGNRFYNQANAINIGGCDGYHIVTKNFFEVASGTVLYLHSRLPDANPGVIANNFIVCGRNSWIANGISIAYGSNYKIYNNTIHVRYSDPLFNASSAFNIDGICWSIQILNNIFANTGGGYIYYVYNNGSPSSISVSDYNDIYTTGPNVAHWSSNVQVTTLDSLQTISGKELHSVSANPGFLSPTDLHVTAAALDSAALPVAEVTDDYDGQLRNSVFPDIGADEFSATNTPPVISNLPSSVEFNADTSYLLNIWQYVEDLETPDSLLSYNFEVSDPALQFEFTPQTGNILLSVDPQTFQGTVQLYITVTDDNWASAYDSLEVIVTPVSGLPGDASLQIPAQFELQQNYPNPFNPVTTIRYGLPSMAQVKIEVFNILGQRVKTLIDDQQPAGYHEVRLEANSLGSGVYFYRLTVRDRINPKMMFVQVRKLMVLK